MLGRELMRRFSTLKRIGCAFSRVSTNLEKLDCTDLIKLGVALAQRFSDGAHTLMADPLIVGRTMGGTPRIL